jgi:hypothetical protein
VCGEPVGIWTTLGTQTLATQKNKQWFAAATTCPTPCTVRMFGCTADMHEIAGSAPQTVHMLWQQGMIPHEPHQSQTMQNLLLLVQTSAAGSTVLSLQAPQNLPKNG